MKKEINIKDKVWIHLGEHKLVEGRVVEIITLDHLNENHIPGKELYVVEIHTGIDDVYEVREWETISLDANGPINCFKNLGAEVRKLKKLGIKATTAPVLRLDDDDDIEEPSQAEIMAALEGKPTAPPKRRHYPRKKK